MTGDRFWRLVTCWISSAKILHPRCVLPVRQYKIPLHVYATHAPGLKGTIISANVADSAAQVKAIAIKKGITLISMESPGMWHQVGFLADAFTVFKDHGLSVDLVSTSETNVTVSLDPAANSLDPAILEALVADLSELCRAQVIGPCASLSLVGRNIRGILHDFGDAFELFYQAPSAFGVIGIAGPSSVGFGGNSSTGGTLSQTFDTSIGQSYTVNYFATSQQGGSAGSPLQTALIQALNGATVLGSVTDTIPNFAVGETFHWFAGPSLTFIATGSSTTLRFTDTTTTGTFCCNWALDGVTVSGQVAAIPEPNTYGLMLAGLGLLGFLARRKYKT